MAGWPGRRASRNFSDSGTPAQTTPAISRVAAPPNWNSTRQSPARSSRGARKPARKAPKATLQYITQVSHTRRRAGMYSEVRVVALARQAPMPMPVPMRQITKSVRLVDQAVAKVATAATTRPSTINGRRPNRSPKGATMPAPTPIPSRAELRARPKLVGLSPQAPAIWGTARAITWMS